MNVDIDILLVIVAGGLFGVVLGKFIDTTPPWVFYLMIVVLFVVVLYLLGPGRPL